MPFDQSYEEYPESVSAKLPDRHHLLIAGALCIVLATIVPRETLQYGFALCGGILLSIAAFLKLSRIAADRTSAHLFQTARRIMMHDMGIGFVTNAGGVVRYANPGAYDRFGDAQGRTLAAVFELMLANPGQCFVTSCRTGARSRRADRRYRDAGRTFSPAVAGHGRGLPAVVAGRSQPDRASGQQDGTTARHSNDDRRARWPDHSNE